MKFFYVNQDYSDYPVIFLDAFLLRVLKGEREEEEPKSQYPIQILFKMLFPRKPQHQNVIEGLTLYSQPAPEETGTRLPSKTLVTENHQVPRFWRLG